MKKVLCLVLALVFALSTMSVLSLVAFATEEAPSVEETPSDGTLENEETEETEAPEETTIPEYTSLGKVQWGTLLLAALKGFENLGKDFDEEGFDLAQFAKDYIESLKKTFIESGYEEQWIIIQTNIEKRMGKEMKDMNVADFAIVVQYLFDIVEHDVGININDLPNWLRKLNLQTSLGPVLNALIAIISKPVEVPSGSGSNGGTNSGSNSGNNSGSNAGTNSGSSSESDSDYIASNDFISPDTGANSTGIIIAAVAFSMAAIGAGVCAKKKEN